jgi:hypothetical protein
MTKRLISWVHLQQLILLTVLGTVAILSASGLVHAGYSDCATDWDNFLPPTGYSKPYTYLGQPVYDYEGSSDPTNGGTGVQPSTVDLASGSPNGSDPGPYDTPSYGYYDGGTDYDPDDPSTMENDFVLFTMRLAGDPSTVKEDFGSYHWNILLDVDNDGYKEYWIDLDGGWTYKGENDEYYDRIQILYDNNNRQDIPNPDAAGVRVDAFRAYNGDETCTSTPCALGQNCSFTRVRQATDGTGDYWIDIQVPMTAFKDSDGNQVLFPDSAVGFVFSTSSSNTNPLQKDFMADLEFLTLNDPINFGDIIKSNGEPELHFADVELNESDFYTVGNDIFLYLMDPLANDYTNTVETVTATVQNPITGDDETVTLTETGPNSGIFSNLGGASHPASSNPSEGWISYVQTSVISVTENYTVTYNSGTGTWTVAGSVSGVQTGRATAGTPYTSDDGKITFTLYQDNPSNGDTITFTTYAGDRLTTSGTAGSDDDGDLQGFSGQTISYSYTNEKSKTFTDQAQLVGPGEPFIQFTRANGEPSTNFELTTSSSTSDKLYVTVYHADSNTNPGSAQTIQVTLTGTQSGGTLDSQTLTLTETGPDTGVFRNTTGLNTKVSDGTITASDNLWEDTDQGEVTATFTYLSTNYTAAATLFYIDDAGRVYFTNGSGTQDVTLYAAGEPVFVKVLDQSYTCGANPMAVTITTSTGDSETINLYETASGSNVYMNRINDLATTAASTVVTSASSDFSTLAPGDPFMIATGPDAGVYEVAEAGTTDLTLTQALTATRTDIGFNADPLMTATYTTGYTANDGVLVAPDEDTLTVTYHDCQDGDSDSGNDDKTDTALYNAPPIVINEVLFYTDTLNSSDREYLQLYNASAAPVTVTGYRITDEDGDLNYTIPQYGSSDIVLDPGEDLYIVLVANASPPDDYTNASGTYKYYLYATVTDTDILGDPNDTDTADQVSLYDDTGTIIDYVGWSTTNQNTLDFKSDDENAVAAAIWEDNNYKDVAADPITQGYAMYRCTDGVDTDTTNDWCYKSSSVNDIIITVVLISSFRVYEEEGNVIVEWETASETGTAGFYLYRRDNSTGRYSQLNDALLPGLLHAPQGGTYRFIDETAIPGATYAYKLVEVEARGKKRTYGPFVVTAGGDDAGASSEARISLAGSRSADTRTKVKLQKKTPGFTWPEDGTRMILDASEVSDLFSYKAHEISEAKQARLEDRNLSKVSAQISKRSQQGNRIKIAVSEDGLYYLDATEIADFLGLPLLKVKRLINGTQLSLTNQGEEVAYLPSAGNSGIYFHGQQIDSIYTRENIYWLAPGRGREMQTIKGRGPAPTWADETFTRLVHAEEDAFATTALFSDPEDDYWLWDFVIAGGDEKLFSIRADAVSGAYGTATLSLLLKGITDDPAVEADHHVVVTVNGTEIGAGYWDGTEAHELVLSFDQTLLEDGENFIGVYGILDTGAIYSIFCIDSIDLTYESHYFAHNQKLLFHGDGNPVVTVSGFTSPEILVFDVTDSKRPKLVQAKTVEAGPEGYSVSIEPSTPVSIYLAIANDAVISELNAWADTPSNLASSRNGADYIVITPTQLETGAKRLADHRETQGLHTMVATLEDIMDEFNDGIYSPHAVKAFLSYAYTEWNLPPVYVVLIGDGTFDYKDNLGYGDNLMPPLMVSTPQGLFASDNQFVDVAGHDGVPEMAIGRLPVVTGEELQALIDKIIDYESSGGTWTKRVLMLADNPDGEGDFPSDSDDVAQLLPVGYVAEKIYLGEMAANMARQQLLDGINRGVGIVNYIGHGGLDRLADEGLLRAADVNALINGERLPVVAAMTCVAGQFAIPGYDCLSESLILKPGGGAVAVWAPTGLSNSAEAKILDMEFFRATFTDESSTLGQAVLSALEGYGRRGKEMYLLDIYTLIGDPALEMK